jgi:anti-anti-sigma regulatory factor
MTVKESDGFDPLAWMNDDDEVAIEEPENKSEVEAVADVKSEAEDVVADSEVAVETTATETTAVEDATIVETEDSKEQEIQAAESDEDSKVTLDATLNIQNVAALYDQFLKKLESQNTIEIDASSVVSIDTATLQLLTVLKQTGINLQKEIVIDFPSDEFIESAELLGLSELLEVNQAAAGFF